MAGGGGLSPAYMYMVQCWVGLIMVGGGRPRWWRTLAGGVRQGSDVIWENPVGNLSMENTTPDPKWLTCRNTLATLPLVNDCKQKHLYGGAHGTRVRNIGSRSNIGRRGSGSRVEHFGLPAQTGSGWSLGGKPYKTLPWRRQLPIPNHLLEWSPYSIGVISYMAWVLHSQTIWSCLPTPSAFLPISG